MLVAAAGPALVPAALVPAARAVGPRPWQRRVASEGLVLRQPEPHRHADVTATAHQFTTATAVCSGLSFVTE